jgi:hypothetical protein
MIIIRAIFFQVLSKLLKLKGWSSLLSSSVVSGKVKYIISLYRANWVSLKLTISSTLSKNPMYKFNNFI